MGKFYNGGQGTKHAQFKAFIDKFMNSQFSTCTIQDMTYEKVLWKYFRNGLAHGFTICHGGFEHQATYFATKSTADRHILIIDPKSFLDDFLNGINEYLNALNKSSYGETIAQNFQKIFKDVFIDGK
jgi:mannosyltransferase OCH1-like enzyme